MMETNGIHVVTKMMLASQLRPGDYVVWLRKERLYVDRVYGQFINDNGMCVIEWGDGGTSQCDPRREMEVIDRALRV